MLLEDGIMEASDAFVFAGRIMGKSAEGRTKWGSVGKVGVLHFVARLIVS